MNTTCLRWLSFTLGLAWSLVPHAAPAAEAGVSDMEIVLGQLLGLTGPLAELAPDITPAAKAYVAGVLPMLAAERPPVPVFAPFTDADAVRGPNLGHVFNIRASYAEEIEKLVQHLSTIGIQRIGMLWINNGIEQDGMAGIEKAMHKRSMAPYATASIQPDGSDTEKAVAELHDKRPEVIIKLTMGVPTVSIIKSDNTVRRGMRFCTLSVMGTQATLRAPGPDGVGVVVTSVVPFPWS